MFKPFYFLLASILCLGLFTQCQDATATKENVTEAVEQTAKKVEEVDNSPQIQGKSLAAALAAEKEAAKQVAVTTEATTKQVTATTTEATTKQVTATTEESADRKKEPTAPKKKKKRKRSKIEFEETTYKFGTIKTGDKVNHKFKFTNTGNAPLVIKNVDVTCGCTFPSYPFLPIEPGEEGEIDVTFNSEHKIGSQKPTVTVVTNGRPRTLKLHMEGFVE